MPLKPLKKRIGFLYKPKLDKNYFNRHCPDRQPSTRHDKMRFLRVAICPKNELKRLIYLVALDLIQAWLILT